MNKIIVLVIAIVAGAGAAFMVKQHLDEVKGDTITVYKAARSKSIGDSMGSHLTPITLPAGLFPEMLEEAPDSNFLSYMQTTPLRAAVREGDILLFRHFDSAIDPGVLPSIPAGKKAISIAVDQESAVSYFIQPGDLVDVMGTFTEQGQQTGSSTGLPSVATRPILQAVEVLAVGNEYRPSERQRLDAYGSITLLVSMEEAAKLIFAQDFYSVDLTLILRSKDDTSIATQIPSIGVNTDNFDEIGNKPGSNVTIKSSR